MQRFIVVVCLVLLAGCSLVCPQQKQGLLQDQIAFSTAFDNYQLTGKLDALEQFRVAYTDSPWAARAQTVIENVRALEALRKAERGLSAELDNLKNEKRQLLEKLAQLKGLLIELEMQPK